MPCNLHLSHLGDAADFIPAAAPSNIRSIAAWMKLSERGLTLRRDSRKQLKWLAIYRNHLQMVPTILPRSREIDEIEAIKLQGGETATIAILRDRFGDRRRAILADEIMQMSCWEDYAWDTITKMRDCVHDVSRYQGATDRDQGMVNRVQNVIDTHSNYLRVHRKQTDRIICLMAAWQGFQLAEEKWSTTSLEDAMENWEELCKDEQGWKSLAREAKKWILKEWRKQYHD